MQDMNGRKITPLDSHIEFVTKMKNVLIRTLSRAAEECRLGEAEKCISRILREELRKEVEENHDTNEKNNMKTRGE